MYSVGGYVGTTPDHPVGPSLRDYRSDRLTSGHAAHGELLGKLAVRGQLVARMRCTDECAQVVLDPLVSVDWAL
jgi:hypothetical protein